MIDRSFIEKIESMAAPAVVETSKGIFSKERLFRVENKTVDTLMLSTLSGLVAMIKKECEKYMSPLYVRIGSPQKVDVFSGLIDFDEIRDFPFAAEAVLPEFHFDKYYTVESMIIALKSRFEPTDDREYLVRLLGNITDNQSVQTKDDGITQSATVRSGIQLVDKQEIKPIVKLKPYRTFLEVEQPESDFLIRLKDGQAALFEADGGAWRNQAMANIGNYLRKKLEGTKDVIVIE